MHELGRVISIIGLLIATLDVAAQAPSLEVSRDALALNLRVRGEAGKVYRLESTSRLGAGTWDSIASWTQTEAAMNWSASLLEPARFFRAATEAEPTPSFFASNFRLIDDSGRARELFYQSDAKAVVLLFTRTGCPETEALAPTLRALRERFSNQGVVFWMVASALGESREGLVAEAAKLGTGWPLLHDDAQLVARAHDVVMVPEVVCVDPKTWTVFYRGGVSSAAGLSVAGSTEGLAAAAVEAFLMGKAPAITRTAAGSCELVYRTVEGVSYSADVAPLLAGKCVRCHSPGGIGPWAMTDHATVRQWAESMKLQILEGHMPPWHADPHHGKFANDFSLSAAEKAKLVAWIDAGAPRGDGPDPLAESPAPPPPAWPLGTPDLILSISTQNIPATGTVDYRYLTIANPLLTNVWLKAAVVRPGNSAVVHHSLAFVATSFADILDVLGGLKGFFAGYVPGLDPVFFPENTGKLLPRGSFLVLQMHYTTTGKAETDRTQIGLYFAPAPPALELKTGAAYTTSFTILPGAQDHEEQAEFTFARDSWLYEMSPHMHFRGSRFRYEAIYPDGKSEVLLSVPNYHFHWQTLYRLAEPKRMPAGTRLVCRGGFDNSIKNPYNPDPAQTVTFGEQTYEEMFIGYLNYAEIR